MLRPKKPNASRTTSRPPTRYALAKRSGSQGIAFTYNEPAIWLEYALDCASLAKEAGLYTVFVTNGFSTP